MFHKKERLLTISREKVRKEGNKKNYKVLVDDLPHLVGHLLQVGVLPGHLEHSHILWDEIETKNV